MVLSFSTVAFVIFFSALISIYYYWRKLFNLPLEGNGSGSFLNAVKNSIMYVLAVLTQHGIKDSFLIVCKKKRKIHISVYPIYIFKVVVYKVALLFFDSRSA